MSYQPTSVALAGRRTLGLRLRHAREARGLTQERLALLAGLDRSFLADVEAGRHSCMVDRLFDLAQALDMQPHELLDPSG